VFFHKGMPPRRDWAGRPISQFPKGSNPVFFQLIDPTGAREVYVDAQTALWFDVYKELLPTDEQLALRAVPPAIQNRFEHKDVNYELTAEQYDKWYRYVGQERLQRFNSLASGTTRSGKAFKKMSPQRKVSKLESEYTAARVAAKKRFVSEELPNLKPVEK
jgi:hypothetical protein